MTESEKENVALVNSEKLPIGEILQLLDLEESHLGVEVFAPKEVKELLSLPYLRETLKQVIVFGEAPALLSTILDWLNSGRVKGKEVIVTNIQVEIDDRGVESIQKSEWKTIAQVFLAVQSERI